MTVLLIAGIAVILAGLAAIGFGVPVKEFGFGNTLILTGAVGVCTGLLILAMAMVVREMRRIAEGIGAVGRLPVSASSRRALNLTPADLEDEKEDEPAAPPQLPPFGHNLPRQSQDTANVPPWQDEVLRDRERLAAAASGASDEPKRRNLMFSSTRRDREQDQAEMAVAQALQLDLDTPEPEPEPAADEPRAPEPRGFDAARPRPERAPERPQPERPQPERTQPRFSDAIRQAARASATHAERFGSLPDLSQIPDRGEEPAPQPPAGVTVLKRGIVDGMAYALYSDGSIEAQMPEGVMRFASIDELRQHLDHRG